MALVVCLLVVAIGGTTLAYFTAENTADNVFTMKGIKIEINENFVQGSDLFPGLDINKDVYLTNTGTADAYARVHIAVPAALDNGNPNYEAVRNFLKVDFTDDSVQPTQWSWTPSYEEDAVGYKGTGEGNWNYYEATIDGIDYNVYVVTYRSVLTPGTQTTTAAIDKVSVDKAVDCDWNEEKGCYSYSDDMGNVVYPEQFEDADGNIHVLVFAEAAQTTTFADAYEALNTAFGTPGSEGYVAPWNR